VRKVDLIEKGGGLAKMYRGNWSFAQAWSFAIKWNGRLRLSAGWRSAASGFNR
jgi:hypothetical protein